MKRLIGTVLLGLALAACGGDGTATSGASSGSSGPSGAGGSGVASSSVASSSGAGGGSPCPAGNICFDVKEVGGTTPIAPGRVAVLWYQINDDGPDPTPSVAYDKPFDPTVTRVNIPIAEITVPGPELLFCNRACDDEAMCPCLSDPQVGFGAVVVAADANQDQTLDATEALQFYGFGWMALGYSDKAYMPAPPPVLDVKFPEGIEQGIRPYRIIDEMGTFDNLGLSQQGDIFDLNVCPAPGPACDVPVPNLT